MPRAKTKVKKRLPTVTRAPNARRIAITFHVKPDELREIATAARECGVKLDAFCGEALAQWLEQYAMMKKATEPPPQRDWLTFSEVDAASQMLAQPNTQAPPILAETETQDDEAPRVDSRANDPDDEDDGGTFPTRRPTGDGPRRIANRAEPEEDEDDAPRTVTPLAASLFRTPNPAGIKWRQGKDYGQRSPGHDWAAIRRPK